MAANSNQNPGCLSKIFPFLQPANNNSTAPTLESFPYRVRDDFLSPAEFSFYKVLFGLIGTRLTIQSKVRLADIFFVARPNENVGSFNRIAQRHLDFLVCDSVTMKPLLGIELDDSSHLRTDRQERDEFVEKVFQAAQLPLLRVPVQREYNSREIAALIAPLLKDQLSVSVPPPAPVIPPPVSNPQASTPPICPKCGIPMVLRTVTQGEHKGKQFYGCTNYPNCRQMKPVSG
jgi:hypothetical protein